MTDKKIIPYSRQEIDQADVEAVVEVLRSDYLTQGPLVERFEAALAEKVGAKEVVALANGTAALHLAALGLGLGPGDVWLTSPLSFVATANAARYVGALPVFVDVDQSGCLDPASLDKAVNKVRKTGLRPKVVAAVDLAGQPADWAGLQAVAWEQGMMLVDDASHGLGARWQDPQGEWRTLGGPGTAKVTVFSFHPVKHMTTGEGGAIATEDPMLARRLRTLRTHGITKAGFRQPEMALDGQGRPNPWYYEQQSLGFNYRLTDLQAALGLSQLKKLDRFVEARRALAGRYDRQLAGLKHVRPLDRRPGVDHAFHLYPVLIDFKALGQSRAEVMNQLLEAGVGTQVHYIPVHLQPDFRAACGTGPGDCPRAEALYEKLLSLPLYPGLSEADQDRVVEALDSI
ncbi:MAG: UDP-4-amino-4,6-dideoxy-N-acetyl-beta-L-altrosamine transaminase, partial [Deltaproteobacteria bacterium]|nr:UDP-4-amino-4,6-dideoxy-N-acetyl-beta-L-altrosamine transaminase [Deltaproteobacteria bacterium]